MLDYDYQKGWISVIIFLKFCFDGDLRHDGQGVVVEAADHDVAEAVDPTNVSPFVLGTLNMKLIGLKSDNTKIYQCVFLLPVGEVTSVFELELNYNIMSFEI